jgi:hypothetical protein
MSLAFADNFSCDTASLASVVPMFASLAAHDSPYGGGRRNRHVSVLEVLRPRRSQAESRPFHHTRAEQRYDHPLSKL